MSGDLELCAHKLKELLMATEASLDKIRARADAGRRVGPAIDLPAGKVINGFRPRSVRPGERASRDTDARR